MKRLREIVENAKLCSRGQVYRLTCSRHEGPRSKTTIKRCFVQRPTLSNCASRRLQFSSCGLQENYRKIEKTETFEPKNSIYINNLCDWRREWDSNPRDPYEPTRVPGVRLQPLGHLSAAQLPGGAHYTHQRSECNVLGPAIAPQGLCLLTALRPGRKKAQVNEQTKP